MLNPSISEGQKQSFGNYFLIEEIGRGGMGVVYRAVHKSLQKEVALKVLTDPSLQEGGEALLRFFREMKTIGKLEHENLICAHDAGEVNGVHYLVMEFVDGVDLGKLIAQNGPFSVSNAAEVICQAAEGLRSLHSHRLVHRDIKVTNLILNKKGIIKILDFGLARDLKDDQSELTPTGMGMGTVDYLAPEQANSSKDADIRSDIYSLGCTLYKLLSGQPPFSSSAFSSMPKKIMAHCMAPVPEFSAGVQDVPPELFSVMLRMLEKNPEDRIQTPGEVVKAMKPFSAGNDLNQFAETIAEFEQTRIVNHPISGVSFSFHDPTAETALHPVQQEAVQAPLSESVDRTRVYSLSETVKMRLAKLAHHKVATFIALCLVSAILYHVMFSLPGKEAEVDKIHALISPSSEVNSDSEKKQAGVPSIPQLPRKLKPLDQSKPTFWRGLLDQDPVPVVWDSTTGKGRWFSSKNPPLLSVSSNKLALLSLGVTQTPHYQITMTMEQFAWKSGSGIYWGLKQFKDGSGRDVWKYQSITTFCPLNSSELCLVRSRGTCSLDENGIPKEESLSFASYTFSDLPDGDLRFDLTFKHKGLAQVQVNGAKIDSLFTKNDKAILQGHDASGEFGVYVKNGSANFQKPEFRKRLVR